MTDFIDPVAGLQIPSVQDLLAAVATDAQGSVDSGITAADLALFNVISGIFCSHLREAYEAVQQVWDSSNPDNAEGILLQNISDLTGTQKLAAQPSTFGSTSVITVNLNAGVTLPAGQIIAQQGNGSLQFKITSTATNSGGSAADISADAVCLQTGPIDVAINTLTVMITSYPGWNGVNNPSAPVLGRAIETDQQLRLRRAQELEESGSSNAKAIKAALIAMTNPDGSSPIIDAVVLENTLDVQANGLPPHSLHVYIWDGPSHAADGPTLGALLYQLKGQGAQFIGTEGLFLLDPQGNSAEVFFDYALQVSILVVVNGLVYDALSYVGDAAVATAIAAAFSIEQGVGDLVAFSEYMAVVKDLPGVKRLSSVSVSLTSTQRPNLDLTLPVYAIALSTSGNVTVNSTPG